jgi:hypothetical protein
MNAELKKFLQSSQNGLGAVFVWNGRANVPGALLFILLCTVRVPVDTA